MSIPSQSNPHNLIPREQTYVCDKHIVSIHSTDRDIAKWKSASHFEVALPQTLNAVETVRLAEISLPTNFDTFSNDLQNTRMKFSILYMNNAVEQEYSCTITIDRGTYLPEELAHEVENKMNITCYGPGSGCSHFHVCYNKVGNRFHIGNDIDRFILSFAADNLYDDICRTGQAVQPTTKVFDRYSGWGLGAALGFDKIDYKGALHTENPHFKYRGKWVGISAGPTLWFAIDTDHGPSTNCSTIEAPNAPNLAGESTVYMEIDRLNTMDELYPYTDTNDGRDASGSRLRSCFAKIPLIRSSSSTGSTYDSKNAFLSNVVQYSPPIERITKLKFKFRTHDGILVDFQNIPFTFTLEFSCIRNEIRRTMDVRTPSAW